MKCPNCGNECDGNTCHLCGTNLKSDKKIYKKLISISYYKWINFLFPISAIILIIMLGLLIKISTLDGRPINFKEWLILMFPASISVVIPFDIIRWNCWGKKKYLKKLSGRIEIYKQAESLINRANKLAATINTTTDRATFETSLIELKDTFQKLIKYEKYGVFNSSSPRQDLQELLNKEDSARKALEERIINETFNYSSSSQETTHTAKHNSSILTHHPLDSLFDDAGRIIIEKNKASIGMLQRVLKIGFNRAASIMDELCEYGVVGEEIGTAPRRVLMSMEQFEMLLVELKTGYSFSEQDESSVHSSPNYDNMEGHDFEYFCADVLRNNGYVDVEVTQGSGDHGIDILAEKDDITYAIQCKCYSSNIGNAAVQQAHTGKSLYHRDVAVVMTNQYFTQQAKEEAAALRVKLWDRDKLNELIEKSML